MTYIKLLAAAVEDARDVCKYLDAGKIDEAKAHTEFYWDALDKIRDMDEAEKNQFNPDWNAVHLLSEENLALHRRIAELEAEKAETPQRAWVGLTAKDLVEIPPSAYEGAIWADAKLKEKNT